MVAPAMDSPVVSFFLLLLFAAVAAAAAESAPGITFPLHRHLPGGKASSAHTQLRRLAAGSLRRVEHLTHRRASALLPAATGLPLSPHSYGAYAFPLAFGSPPQRLTLLLDTGSHISWFPCTRSYRCMNCTFASSVASAAVFLPNASSSAHLVPCGDPACRWIHSTDALSNCSRSCPAYLIVYGSGSTAGLLLRDTLHLPSPAPSVPDFVVGCSIISEHQPPIGLAGFARGDPSLPVQLRLPRFSYCLISRRFDDDTVKSGSLVLGGPAEPTADGGAGAVTEPFQYAPFIRNPSGNATEHRVSSVYYYLALQHVTVGGQRVSLPEGSLAPDAAGNGGTIIDSGTTFTYADVDTFYPILKAFTDRMGGLYNRSGEAERGTGLVPCFALPAGTRDIELPEMAFHFRGGGTMQLPPENYFVMASGSDGAMAVCLALISGVGTGGRGPKLIIGSFQQQNFYVTYDLERQRLGFRRQQCVAAAS